jgi:hypothetical protein
MQNDTPDQAAPPPLNRDLQGLKAFIRQALINTSQAFVAPTVAGALLPPAYRSLAFVPAGAILANQRLNPGPQHFEPELTRHQHLVATGLGFSPFLLLLPLHAKYAHLDTPIGAKVRHTWERVSGMLRGPMGLWLRKYPVNFVCVRAMAQLSASALGATLAYQHVTATTGSRYVASGSAPPAPLSGTHKARALATGAAWFSVPAALGLPQVRSLVPGLGHLGPAGTTALITASLIAAALCTIAQVPASTSLTNTGA